MAGSGKLGGQAGTAEGCVCAYEIAALLSLFQNGDVRAIPAGPSPSCPIPTTVTFLRCAPTGPEGDFL